MTFKKKLDGFLEQAALFFAVMFYLLFAWHQWWAGVSPRLIRGSAERVAIHHAHLSIGSTLFVFAVFAFLIWAFRPGASIRIKLKRAFESGSRAALSLFAIMVFGSMLTGLAQAWAKDEHTAVFGVFELPHFLNWSWSTSGYLHSSLSTMSVALFSGIAFIYLFIHLRRYVSSGVAVGLLMVLHLLVNLPKPPSVHPIAAFGTYVLVPSYYLIALFIYCWVNDRKWAYWPIYGLLILFFLYLPYFAFKVLPPWHQTAAEETVLVEAADDLADIRTRKEIFADDKSLAVAKAATSWCSQCHNLVKSDTHLLGPNLDGVFNRQAGTASGYGRYSKAMIAAGQGGLFWTRDNLQEFLTHGQNFIPGNLMNQQTDFSDLEKLNRAIDYLEYISAE